LATIRQPGADEPDRLNHVSSFFSIIDQPHEPSRI
jgi:hypothetical protein